MGVVLHQHSTSKVPARAGAHWFAPPHKGQVDWGSGVSSEIMVAPIVPA